MNVEVVAESDLQEAREAVLAGLVRYNERFLGPGRKTETAVTVRDESGRIVGGATAHLYRGRLFIDFVWVDEDCRGKGVGTQVMRAIEAEGRRLGATCAQVDTFTFQAAPFYERLGYREVARIPKMFGGYDRIYLEKESLAVE
ncbi:GNAT family N-acetyltransferase [bacterium]|nr:MAG: GNAT family N-acetyltransferase [bacterium]